MKTHKRAQAEKSSRCTQAHTPTRQKLTLTPRSDFDNSKDFLY